MGEAIYLYDGDPRLDTLSERIGALIYETCGHCNIPLLAVVGVLEDIKLQLLEEIRR